MAYAIGRERYATLKTDNTGESQNARITKLVHQIFNRKARSLVELLSVCVKFLSSIHFEYLECEVSKHDSSMSSLMYTRQQKTQRGHQAKRQRKADRKSSMATSSKQMFRNIQE